MICVYSNFGMRFLTTINFHKNFKIVLCSMHAECRDQMHLGGGMQIQVSYMTLNLQLMSVTYQMV